MDWPTIFRVFAWVKLWRAFFRSTKNLREQIALGPHYTVDGLARCTTDRANRKTFLDWFRVAVVTLRLPLLSVSTGLSDPFPSASVLLPA